MTQLTLVEGHWTIFSQSINFYPSSVSKKQHTDTQFCQIGHALHPPVREENSSATAAAYQEIGQENTNQNISKLLTTARIHTPVSVTKHKQTLLNIRNQSLVVLTILPEVS